MHCPASVLRCVMEKENGAGVESRVIVPECYAKQCVPITLYKGTRKVTLEGRPNHQTGTPYCVLAFSPIGEYKKKLKAEVRRLRTAPASHLVLSSRYSLHLPRSKTR